MPFNIEQLQTLVYPFAGNDPETDIMLFFTDNKNEPRSINVRRCIETDEQFTGNPFEYSGQELRDFINACPRVPEKPIQFSFQTVTDENAVELESNFKSSEGLIFAYQNVYKNGYVSSLSSFSKVAYPPAIATLGNRTPEEVSVSNNMLLTIPKQNNEVRDIKILYKEGDGGVWKLIDQVGANEDFNNINYTFVGDEETADRAIVTVFNTLGGIVWARQIGEYYTRLRDVREAADGNVLAFGHDYGWGENNGGSVTPQVGLLAKWNKATGANIFKLILRPTQLTFNSQATSALETGAVDSMGNIWTVTRSGNAEDISYGGSTIYKEGLHVIKMDTAGTVTGSWKLTSSPLWTVSRNNIFF